MSVRCGAHPNYETLEREPSGESDDVCRARRGSSAVPRMASGEWDILGWLSRGGKEQVDDGMGSFERVEVYMNMRPSIRREGSELNADDDETGDRGRSRDAGAVASISTHPRERPVPALNIPRRRGGFTKVRWESLKAFLEYTRRIRADFRNVRRRRAGQLAKRLSVGSSGAVYI